MSGPHDHVLFRIVNFPRGTTKPYSVERDIVAHSEGEYHKTIASSRVSEHDSRAEAERAGAFYALIGLPHNRQ